MLLAEFGPVVRRKGKSRFLTSFGMTRSEKKNPMKITVNPTFTWSEEKQRYVLAGYDAQYEYAGALEECRGENKQGGQTAQREIGATDAFNAAEEARRNQLSGLLLPGYENLINKPGYDAATKAAITNASQGAAGAAYGSAADEMTRRAARTGNTAGVVEGEDLLAREKAGTMSDIAAKNQIQFADASRGDVRAGLQGLGGLYGMDTSMLARTLGLPAEYINAQTDARRGRPGFWETLGNSYAGTLGGGIGAGAMGGGG